MKQEAAMENAERKARARRHEANEGTERKKIWQGQTHGWHVLNGRVFGIFPAYPLSLHGYCLRSARVRRGFVHCTASILYASPTHRHPPQRVNPVHLILAFFVLHKPLRPGPHLPSIPASCVRSYDFAPHYIRIVPMRSTVDGEKKEEMGIRREHGRKRVREEGDRERDKEEQGKYEISRTKGATAVCT